MLHQQRRNIAKRSMREPLSETEGQVETFTSEEVRVEPAHLQEGIATHHEIALQREQVVTLLRPKVVNIRQRREEAVALEDDATADRVPRTIFHRRERNRRPVARHPTIIIHKPYQRCVSMPCTFISSSARTRVPLHRNLNIQERPAGSDPRIESAVVHENQLDVGRRDPLLLPAPLQADTQLGTGPVAYNHDAQSR